MEHQFKKKFSLNLGVSLGVVLILLVINFLIDADLTRRAAAVEAAKRDLALRAKAIESLAVLKDEARRADGYRSALEQSLPKSDELINFRSNLRALAQARNLDFTFSFGAETPLRDNQPAFTGFQMTISGPTRAFMEFLRDLERSIYFVDLENIDMSQSGDRFSATLAGRVFGR